MRVQRGEPLTHGVAADTLPASGCWPATEPCQPWSSVACWLSWRGWTAS